MTKITLDLAELLPAALGHESAHVPATIELNDLFEFSGVYDHEIDIGDLLKPHKMIADIWSASDVQEACDWLTIDEAFDVLKAIEHDFDANVGINWEVIEAKAVRMFGDGEDRKIAKRVERCKAALDEYDMNLVDLLTDMRHFCDAEDVDFSKEERRSYEHYLAEKE
jgi:hypothetical protein